ncbi:MAG: CreA family protein [Oceanibaculum nanhaiense]|nr:CreA family protein [Oceanibaculum nanhaiense]
MHRLFLLAALLIGLGAIAAPAAKADEIGCVDSAFQWIGPNHKICIEAFDDPEVPGVSCHISRAKTGGIKGWVGLAEDTSDASIACRQTGPISLPKKIADADAGEGKTVFRESRSIIFKKLQVVRFYDKKRNTLVYLTYSDRLIEGSPQNAVTSVPIMPWR